MALQMKPVDAMATCTVRIVAGSGTASKSVGTGFLYGYPHPAEPDQIVVVVLTNKHVLAECDWARIILTVGPRGGALGEFGRPVGAHLTEVDLPLAQLRVDHPQDNVDLCAVLIGPAMGQLDASGLLAHHFFMGPQFRLTAEQRAYTRAIEPIAMVGYPRGLWDHINNAPIVRRGVTATHPCLRYEGRSEFMIDAACFPGSSGSPVFLFEDGMYRSSENAYSPGSRIALLGVLYAGPQFDAAGELVAKPIPHSIGHTPVTSIPMNLGYVIAAEEIDVLGLEVLRFIASGGV